MYRESFHIFCISVQNLGILESYLLFVMIYQPLKHGMYILISRITNVLCIWCVLYMFHYNKVAVLKCISIE